MTTAIEKSKIFGTVSTITTEADQGNETFIEVAAGYQNGLAEESKIPLVELGDLMSKLEQLVKSHSAVRRTARNYRRNLRITNENLENYFDLARATEEKLQQMANKMETTEKEREKHIKKDMEEMKRRYETVNEKLWNLETEWTE